MLKTRLTHPEILGVLGRAGHGATVLLADGNYPASTKRGPRSTLVSLNVAPDLVRATDLLSALVAVMPVEEAFVMQPPGSEEPEIFGEYRPILADAGFEGSLVGLERYDFYARASDDDLALVIATGESRLYANLLLRIGVVHPT